MGLLKTLQTAVVTALGTIPSVPTIVARDTLCLLEGDDLPLLVVVITADNGNEEHAFGGAKIVTYSVSVACTYEGNFVLDDSIDPVADMRKLVTAKLRNVAITTGIKDYQIVETPLFDTNILQNYGYKVSTVQVKYRGVE